MAFVVVLVLQLPPQSARRPTKKTRCLVDDDACIAVLRENVSARAGTGVWRPTLICGPWAKARDAERLASALTHVATHEERCDVARRALPDTDARVKLYCDGPSLATWMLRSL
jgi:hypothetical protein